MRVTFKPLQEQSLYTRFSLDPTVTGVALAAAGVAVAAMMRSRPRQKSWDSPERRTIAESDIGRSD